jgi:hypothetical protein
MNWLVLLLALTQIQRTPPAPPSLQVVGPEVVFFGPTQAERDSIIKVDGLEMAQLFDDFDYYSGKAASFLQGRGIRVAKTSAVVIYVKVGERTVRTFERKSLGDVVGEILSDGIQEPKLIQGLLTDEELIDEFVNFYRQKGSGHE